MVFTTIQAAISAAATVDGDIILVCPGPYNENVVVNKSVVLVGLKGTPDRSCIEAEPTQPCVFADGSASAITITTVSGVTVRGFKVTNSGGAGNAGILVNTTMNTLLKNTAFDNLGHGIRIVGASNTVEGNNAHDNDEDGIHVEGTGNTLTDNKAHDNVDDGFEFEVSTGGTTSVNDNRARKNGDCGFEGAAIYGTGKNRNRADNNDGGDFCEPESATGSIKGRVTESDTNAKLGGVLVTVTPTGDTDTTSGDGKYTIDGVTAGSRTVTATRGDCAAPVANVGFKTVTVVAGGQVTVHLKLNCP